MSSKKIAIIAIIAIAVFNSASGAVMKIGLQEIPPLSFVALRFFVAALCILPFFISKGTNSFSQIRELIPISLFASLNVIFFILGLNLTTANISSLMYAAVPLIVGLVLFLFFREKLSKGQITGILIGFIGVMLVTFLPLIQLGNPFSGNLLGNFLLMLAITFWSFYMVYSKSLQKTYSPFMVSSNFILVTSILLLPFFFWDLINNFGWWQNVTFSGVFAVLFSSIIMTVLAYMLYQYAIKHGGSVFASTTFYLSPLLAFVVNFFVLGELLTPVFIFGSILALLGTYLVVRK